jgi:hypothetical protein
MTEKSNSYSGTRVLVIAGALVIIVCGINKTGPFLAYFLAFVFLFLSTPRVSDDLWPRTGGCDKQQRGRT